MGRIEEALAKLQARGQPSAGRAPPAQKLGAVQGPREASGTVEHAYGGRRIEIHFEQLHAERLLAPDTREHRLMNEYRMIKRPLLRNADPNAAIARGNLIMVASALASEGKTFTCVNLSLSMAREHDWSVVLVDGDCVKPHLTRSFGAEKEPGLMDLLRDSNTAFDSYVMPTSIPGLAILPAGPRVKDASELLVSARMRSLCEEISATNPRRIVLFDSAPLLLTSESPSLATQVGQVVVVVRANRTPQNSVVEALDKLDPAKAINLVLNDATADGMAYEYGDYQGYAD